MADRLRRSPIALAFDAGTALPKVIEDIADIADRRAACVMEQARTLLGGLGLLPARSSQLHPSSVPQPPPSPTVSHGSTGSAAGAALAPPQPASVPASSETSAGDVESASPVEVGPDPDELPIPAYDSLSASQVVPRLASLEPDDLELIRRYESAGRGRRTILNRVAQLQGA